MKVIFIHGYKSGTESTKWAFLRSRVDWIDSAILELDYDTMTPFDIEQKFLTLWIEKFARAYDVVLVGHSLGGMVASFLSTKFDVEAILLNPSMFPEHSTGYWNVSQKLSAMAAIAKNRMPAMTAGQTVLLEAGDEVIDSKKSYTFFKSRNWNVTMLPGGDHRFKNMDALESALAYYRFKP